MRRFLRRFGADDGGSVTVEAVLVLPALFWAYLGCYVFFGAFHAQSVSVKAAYTIGDILTRQTEVTPEFMDSLYALHDFLVTEDAPRRMRVTAFSYDQDDDRHEVVWSQVRGGGQALTTATIASLRDGIPIMANGDVAVLTETWVDHRPPFRNLLDDFTYAEFVVTRPRAAAQLCWNSVNDGDMTTATC